jgi:hypothetical protein
MVVLGTISGKRGSRRQVATAVANRNPPLCWIPPLRTGQNRRKPGAVEDVSAMDLPAHLDKPEVRRMYRSRLAHMDSDAFAPKHELDAGLLRKIFPE